MKAGKMALSVLAGIFALAARGDGALTDDEVKARIVKFVRMPSLLCGHAAVDFRNELRTRKLTNRPWFDGDTNCLARLICELAQTNNAEIAEMMIDALGEYGLPAQLPFLYSCATNPLVGDRAVKAVLRIEGVTSNSLDVARNYFMVTNGVPHLKEFDRTRVCRSLLKEVFDTPDLLQFQPLCMSITLEFGKNVNIGHISLDDTIRDVDPTYRYSKRRLAVMRSAQSRCVNPDLHNYVTNAINELVAYPEANLPE